MFLLVTFTTATTYDVAAHSSLESVCVTAKSVQTIDTADTTDTIEKPTIHTIKSKFRTLIMDTDMGTGGCMDNDDVAALVLAFKLLIDNTIQKLVVVTNTVSNKSVDLISILADYYNITNNYDFEIGAYNGPGNASHCHTYVNTVVDMFSTPSTLSQSQVPDSLELYQRTLLNAEPNSVIIASIGLATNIARILRLEPELVATKVESLSIMGGKFNPSTIDRPECNFCGCHNGATPHDAYDASLASSYLFEHWPTSVNMMITGFEVGFAVTSGGTLPTCTSSDNPFRVSYEIFAQVKEAMLGITLPDISRFSWDPIAVLVAVLGPDNIPGLNGSLSPPGYNIIDPNTGFNTWIPTPLPTSQSLVTLTDANLVKSYLDKLYCFSTVISSSSPPPPFHLPI
jgi:Inosine-uridine preferring nucleoside hydrolase